MPKIHDWIQQTFEDAQTIFPLEPQLLIDSFTQALQDIKTMDQCNNELIRVISKEFYSMDVEHFLIHLHSPRSIKSTMNEYNLTGKNNEITRWFLEALLNWCGSSSMGSQLGTHTPPTSL